MSSSPTLSKWEWKTLLSPAPFVSNFTDAVTSYMGTVTAAAASAQKAFPGKVDVSPSSKVSQATTHISFYDTAAFALNKGLFMLRVRSGADDDVTLKFRGPVESTVFEVNVASSLKGSVDSIEFAEEVLLPSTPPNPPPPGTRPVYMTANEIDSPHKAFEPMPATIEGWVDIFPALGALGVTSGTAMSVVNGLDVTQTSAKICSIEFNTKGSPPITAKGSINLWTTGTGTNMVSLCAEFSFEYKHNGPPATSITTIVQGFYEALQAVVDPPIPILYGSTKTAMVYSWQSAG